MAYVKDMSYIENFALLFNAYSALELVCLLYGRGAYSKSFRTLALLKFVAGYSVLWGLSCALQDV